MFEPYPGRKGSRLGRLAILWRKWMIHRRIKDGGYTSHIVKYEGLKYHYYCSNNVNPPLVLMHGFLDSSHTFRRLFRELSESYNVYAIDAPGFGFAKMPPIRELWNMRSVARNTARFVHNCLGLEQPRVLTHSMGGVLAGLMQEYMLGTYKMNMFSEMHMIAPGLFKFGDDKRTALRRLMFPQSLDEIQELLEALFHTALPELRRIFLEGLLYDWSRTGYYYLAENTIEEEDKIFFTAPRLKALKIPLILYGGKEDRVVPLSMLKRIKAAKPRTKLIVLDEAGHSLHIEKADDFLGHFAVEAARRG